MVRVVVFYLTLLDSYNVEKERVRVVHKVGEELMTHTITSTDTEQKNRFEQGCLK
jgi:hypothetical protein